ncbi:hypothetical protein JYU34_018748 [Plutella xylostella]|uniref:Reverse transcriptase domain-containing protein n=1 Tax=Plutella xylostella TaxID=51655 RepID=A0ABQ7PYC8_PLUXY|nr:hypothetical protein JYU34_018748 [Plutella xylostella]
MDGGGQVDCIYTDYSKAFDRIDHSLLLCKLHRLGIHGDLFRWFSSYVTRRSQAVAVNGFLSPFTEISSGVPQGSLLGPLLFVIFINDITSCFQHSQLFLFADDMKIAKRICSADDQTDLQSDLCRLDSYCLANKLDLNVSKCYLITFTRKIHPLQFGYSLKNTDLIRVNQVRDLGVVHDEKLLFDHHIDQLISKANKSMGFLIRISRNFTKIKTIKIIYCAYVRSILEYASQVWNPRYHEYIDRVEKIQKRFLRYLSYRTGIADPSYDDRCKRHHLLPLSNRRQIADIIFFLKIIHGLVDSPELLSLIKFFTPSKQIRQPSLFYVPLVSSNYRQNSFFWRVPNLLNNILRDHSDLDIFINSIASISNELVSDYFGSHKPS